MFVVNPDRSQLEMLLRREIASYVLAQHMESYLSSRFVEELAHAVAEALRADARALAAVLQGNRTDT